MLLKRLGSRLEQSTYSWLLPSWSKSILTYSVAGALFLLLAVVGFAGCFGIVHYRDYVWLKAENAHLHQKKTELDKLQLTLRSIRKDEDAIRNFLGLRRQLSLCPYQETLSRALHQRAFILHATTPKCHFG
jgi:hypothetical protein